MTDPARLRAVSRAATKSAAIFGLFLVACAVGLGLYSFNHSGRIYEGVSVGNVSLSGMTPSEARIALASDAQTYLAQPVQITYEGSSYAFSPVASGVSLDLDGTIAAAMNVGRTGSIWHRSHVWARSLIYGANSSLVLTVDRTQFERALATLAPAVIKAPTNAYVNMSAATGPAIVAEQSGIGFDSGSTGAALLHRLSIESSASVAIVAPMVSASITSAELQSSLTPAQAMVSEPLTLNALSQSWTVAPADLQRLISVDPSNNSVNIDSVSVKKFVASIADQLDSPAKDAQLYVDPNGALAVSPATESIKVNVNATTQSVLATLAAGRHQLDVDLTRAAPAISDQTAHDALTKAQALVDKGVAITWKGGSARLTPLQLLAAITIESDPASSSPFKIGFSPEVISSFVEPITRTINVAGKNATFRIVSGKVKLMSEAVVGQAVDLQKSVDAVTAAAMGGKGTAALTVATVTPKYTSADIKKLTVPNLLGDSSTDYSTATDAKRTNVENAAGLENGWLVAPGDVFSYDQVMGTVDEKHGFVTGLGILSDPTTGGITTGPVIGGGICQVSTTIFQAAFWAGMDVVERYSHPYWIKTYGQAPHGMFGLDAMVDIEDAGSLDMQFKNTTDNWVAVVVTTDGSNVVAKIMGTDQGWNVDVQQPVISNYVDPAPGTIFTDSPEVPTGEKRPVESSSRGFDATVRRVITDKSGTVINDYTMTSTYVPSQDRVLVGTGPAN